MKSTIITSVSVTEKVAPGMSDDSDCEKVPEMPPTHASKSKPFWQIRATSRQTPTSSQSSSSENKKYGCTSCLNIFDSFRILQEMTVAKTKTTLQSNKKWNIRKSANKGWLITTKGFDQEARLAQKRSAAIDRQIEEDSHRQKREAQVMVTSFDRKCEGTSLLLEALSSYCTGTKPPLLPQGQRGISDDDAALAGKVRNAVLKELCRIFEEIGQTCGIDVDSDVHTRDLDRVAVLKTCLDLYHKVEGRIHEKKSLQGDRLDDEIASKVKTLWENEIWLEECYRRKARRSKVFDEILLELLARASRSDYVPVASDLARLTRLPTNFPHVISKSYEIDCTLINIINQDNIPCCAPIRKRLCNYLNDLTSALVLVDLASYTYTNPTGDGNPVQNGLHDTLMAFESYTKYCNRVLGNNTKIMVLFWNCQAFKEKLKSGKYPLEKYFPDFKHGEHTYLKFMAQKFAAAWDKGGGMSQIEIRCGEPSDADVIKWIGSTVKTTLLDQGLCELGLFKPRTGGDKLWYGRR